MKAKKAAQAHTISLTSGYGLQRGPFVTLQAGAEAFQMTVEEARHHANAVLQVAEAAEMDGILFAFFQNKLGQTPQTTASLVMEFRALRDALARERAGIV